jgi:hypothetical protein
LRVNNFGLPTKTADINNRYLYSIILIKMDGYMEKKGLMRKRPWMNQYRDYPNIKPKMSIRTIV